MIVKRPVTIDDKDDVAARALRACGPVAAVCWGNDKLICIQGIVGRRSLRLESNFVRLDLARLAAVGLVQGEAGWLIEVSDGQRQPLPAPWRWWGDAANAFLAPANNGHLSIAHAFVEDLDPPPVHGAKAWIWFHPKGPHFGRRESIQAESLDAAQAKAEELAWSLDLFSNDHDGPPSGW